jgi:quercetin dioxygenase-like cupin family protein
MARRTPRSRARARPSVKRWDSDLPPTLHRIHEIFASEGLFAFQWSARPGRRFAEHKHIYHKVLFVVQGGITFHLECGTAITLGPGDRIDLPAGTRHSAIAWDSGVRCMEALVD